MDLEGQARDPELPGWALARSEPTSPTPVDDLDDLLRSVGVDDPDDVGATGRHTATPTSGSPGIPSRIWPLLVGALGTALLFTTGGLVWLLASGDGDDGEVTTTETAAVVTTAGPTADGRAELEEGAAQLRTMLRGMDLDQVTVEIRDDALYLVGSVPTDEDFADAIIAAGALPTVARVDLTELSSESRRDNAFAVGDEADEPEPVTIEAEPEASIETRLALQAELDMMLTAIPLLFESGSASIEELPKAVIETSVASLLVEHPGTVVRLVGHTDASGSASANRELSLARAEAVSDLLVAQGIAIGRLRVEGLGSEGATGDADADRRVDVVVLLDDG